MATCQLCGEETDSTTKTKIEGAVLQVCDSCAEMGEKVKTKSKKKKRKKKKKSRRRRKRNEEVLINDYGKKVKEARESKQLSIMELADDLNEKESLLKKIEQQELKPEKSLAQKLEKKFNLELYTIPEAWDQETDSGDSRSATLGDVAEVKED
ncbi:multiprotein bridging factor aMBF1 [Candidatus Nanohalovita haloferacivicina]|uniref:multiprotein bridging factor aMBF1 n=1 Tax=Candidatus Nanohalovita haloferacivicina TaxID=2978046 RepID=UPI00325F96C6|nr:Putative transcription factor [Candidatus Nanohalobia archaeon BNXNv]